MKRKKIAPKSIMHNKDDRTCYLCMKLNADYRTHPYLEEHHVLGGTANRRLSDRFGLYVYLCYAHHNDQYSPEAVHFNKDIADDLKADAQRAFMREYPEEDFISIFGKNYL